MPDPLSIWINSYGTAKDGRSDEELTQIIQANFNFRPVNMIRELDLFRPIYRKSAVFGAFGRKNGDYKWEKPK